ncbi:unnamed protein product [Cladocopium goreaui]|uniref:Uncharacterized protein n=1 Tax=Cladocopium goreaui TaxID=2562237 RepID=A0A9P1BRG6_9DINO|nr:unnamed protein product [Cladocopium goreaui]
MARGHRLDETEQGATLQQKDMEIRCNGCARDAGSSGPSVKRRLLGAHAGNPLVIGFGKLKVQDAPTVEEVEDDSVAGKNFAEIFGADADDADSDFSDSDEEEEEEAVEADASDSSTSESEKEEGFRGLTPQALMLLIRKAVDEEDEDTVRKALRVAWSEGAHPDEKDAEFLSQLRDWLGEDEALNALILQNGLQREMAMEEVYIPCAADFSASGPEALGEGTLIAREVKMAPEAFSCNGLPSGLLVMRSYYFEEKPEEEPPREVAKQSKPVPQYLGLNLEEHRDFFHEAACTLDDLLTKNFGVHLPPQDLMWPSEPLHMTTFFLGGAQHAQHAQPGPGDRGIEGSIWELQTAHLIYLEGALLMMSLRVPDALPLDVGCLPHATLLCGPGFAPRDANEVLARATDLGWLDDVAQLSTGCLDVLGSVRNLYIQPFPDFVLPARLEAFWSQPKNMLGWVGWGIPHICGAVFHGKPMNFR